MADRKELVTRWRERAHRFRDFAAPWGAREEGDWYPRGPLGCGWLPEEAQEAAEALWYALVREAAALEAHADELERHLRVEARAIEEETP